MKARASHPEQRTPKRPKKTPVNARTRKTAVSEPTVSPDIMRRNLGALMTLIEMWAMPELKPLATVIQSYGSMTAERRSLLTELCGVWNLPEARPQ